MPDLMGGQLASEGVALPPGVQPAVADVVVVVDRADVVARVAAAVPAGVVDGVDARVGPERVAIGRLGVLPGHTDEPGQPPDLSPAHAGVHVDRAVLVAVAEPEQLAVVEPVLLPGGRRVSQLALRLCHHQILPPPRPFPLNPHQRDRMTSELACRTSYLQRRGRRSCHDRASTGTLTLAAAAGSRRAELIAGHGEDGAFPTAPGAPRTCVRCASSAPARSSAAQLVQVVLCADVVEARRACGRTGPYRSGGGRLVGERDDAARRWGCAEKLQRERLAVATASRCPAD